MFHLKSNKETKRTLLDGLAAAMAKFTVPFEYSNSISELIGLARGHEEAARITRSSITAIDLRYLRVLRSPAKSLRTRPALN